ncbi:hypothetical protein ACFFQF_32735 [Haladaptatus pallidirubidus]|uniref:hypothetical protein n=1 Tax=Haladaptatus pallidirubidus TaxID=1008152 RepID=UPI0035E5EFDE
MSKTETTEESTREQTNGRKLVVENKVTLDGVFDKQAEWQMQFWGTPMNWCATRKPTSPSSTHCCWDA